MRTPRRFWRELPPRDRWGVTVLSIALPVGIALVGAFAPVPAQVRTDATRIAKLEARVDTLRDNYTQLMDSVRTSLRLQREGNCLESASAYHTPVKDCEQ